jgi:GH15 family glucan-1,4-alpha-glucosidase
VALDRLIRLHESGYKGLSVDRFRHHRALIRDTVETRGYNERLQSYTRTLDGDDVDASLLLLPLYGYCQATNPRMRSTRERIEERLARGSLLYRYHSSADDGLPPGEGAFGICSFWALECLAREGRSEEARRRFEQLLTYANDVGLYAEEIDPETGAAIGNFPQAFTHVGQIYSALTLTELGSLEPQGLPETATAGATLEE